MMARTAIVLGMMLVAACGGAPEGQGAPATSSAASTLGAACDLGDRVVMGCDGAAHATSIVRYTLSDGDVITCWEGQATVEPAALSCPAGTACIVFEGGAQYPGVCR